MTTERALLMTVFLLTANCLMVPTLASMVVKKPNEEEEEGMEVTTESKNRKMRRKMREVGERKLKTPA